MGRGMQQRTHADFVTKLSGQRFQRAFFLSLNKEDIQFLDSVYVHSHTYIIYMGVRVSEPCE